MTRCSIYLPAIRMPTDFIPAVFNSRMAGQAGIHLDFDARVKPIKAQSQIKMDPSFRWDDDLTTGVIP
jgi:hypothetical protein